MKRRFSSYCLGFALSIILTLAAFIAVQIHVNSYHELLSHQSIVIAIFVFAFTQLIVQLVFFLHLGQEPRPRWNLILLGAMAVVLVIVIAGSLWIMQNLNYHMMTPIETKVYMKNHEGL